MPDVSTTRRLDLDGFRGVAIALVLVFHYVARAGFYRLPASPIAVQFLDSLSSGVDIFFVLSGFLIGGIVLDHGRAINFYKVFYWRRALRIWPVALFTIAFSYLVIPLLNLTVLWTSQTPAYTYLLLINNFWTASGLRPYPPLGPMWSLAIEEQFYLLCPALMLSLNARTRLYGLTGILLISPILRSLDLHFSPWDFTPFRLDGFAAGILIAELIRNPRYAAFADANRKAIGIATAGLVLAAVMFGASPHYTGSQHVAWGLSLNTLAAAAVVLYLQTAGSGLLARMLSGRGLVMLGRESYFIYMMHIPILACVETLDVPETLKPPLALALCLLYAWASWRWPEAYLTRLGRRFSYRSPNALELSAADGDSISTPSSRGALPVVAVSRAGTQGAVLGAAGRHDAG
jgi:peptidoglycan/LPS O-acetylase OafA/YrhL